MTQYLSDGAHFSHVNVLGSETQTTDWAGGGGQGILYYPWGQVWSNPSGKYGSSFLQDFASLQLYDTSTDGYVPPFRYYVPEQGRWLTPDLLGGAITNPQSLNRYAYGLNNPTTFVDPLGLDPSGSDGFDGVDCRDPTYAESHAECRGPGSPWCFVFPDDAGCSGGVWGGGGGGGVGGGGSTSSGGSANSGNAFVKNPLPCIDPSVLEDAIVNALNWLFMPAQPITKTQIVTETVQGGGNDFNFYDPTIRGDNGLIVDPTYWPDDIHRINKGLGKIFNHPEDYQIYVPQPADAVPGPGKVLHVTFDQGPTNPATGLPTMTKISAHFDLSNPLEGDPGRLIAHGLGDVLAAWVFSHAQGGCGVKFQ